MLTQVTGLPGAGKTLYTLAKLLPQYRGRSIYVDGIPAIDHEHFGTQPLEDPEKWYELPEGSVVIIDEAQRIFPVRRAGSQVPEKCSQFETHRHRGFDIVLLTQDGSTLDVHIRKLTGRHLHVHRLFGGQSANVYEYQNFESKPTDRNVRKGAVRVSTWKYDKAIFDHYKSADIHTVKRRLPPKLVILPLLGLALVGAILLAIYAIGRMVDTDMAMVAGGADPGSGNSPGAGAAAAQSLSWPELYTPEIEGLPWTAPVYRDLLKARSFPKPICAIHGMERRGDVGRCQCYTQQMTKLHDVSPGLCRQIAHDGWFDVTKSPERGRRQGAERRQPPRQAGNVDGSEWRSR